MERLELIIRGRVQGVMFRAFVARHAYWLGLRGEVRNRSDGTVHVIAEGEHQKLEKLHALVHRGPLFARVDAVEAVWAPALGTYAAFSIRYA